MPCSYHIERAPVGICCECGRFICIECRNLLGGKMYCQPCSDKLFIGQENQIDTSCPVIPPSIKVEKQLVTSESIQSQPPVTIQETSPRPEAAVPAEISGDMISTGNKASVGQSAESTKLKSLSHSTPALPGETGPIQGTAKDRSQTLNIHKLQLLFPGGLSLRKIGSLFCFRLKPLHMLKIASLTGSVLMFLAVVVLPWVELSGFGLGIFNISGGIAAGCVIFLLAYASATFIIDRKLRSLVHIATAVVCLLFWMIFRLTLFQEISEFAISRSDNTGVGLIVFVASVILGIIIGVVEMFPRMIGRFGAEPGSF